MSNVSVDNPGGSLTTGQTPPLTVTTKSRGFKPPESWTWNVTFQRELFWNSAVQVGYIGRRGLHLPQVSDWNQPTAGALLANPGVNTNALRPYAGYASILAMHWDVNSMYNGLQLSWNKRFSGGFGFGFSYTYSKSMDGGSNYNNIAPDTYNTRNLWGPSEFDVRHAAVINYVYALPFFKKKTSLTSKLLGGWKLAVLRSSRPECPAASAVPTIMPAWEVWARLAAASEGQFWVLNGTPTDLGQFANTSNSPNQYFAVKNASGSPIFTAPAPGTFNLQPGVRDEIYGPGFQDWNIGLFKKFVVNERTGFEFRSEVFDFPNHPNWSGPEFNPTSSTFGKVTSKTALARTIQLSLRWYF